MPIEAALSAAASDGSQFVSVSPWASSARPLSCRRSSSCPPATCCGPRPRPDEDESCPHPPRSRSCACCHFSLVDHDQDGLSASRGSERSARFFKSGHEEDESCPPPCRFVPPHGIVVAPLADVSCTEAVPLSSAVEPGALFAHANVLPRSAFSGAPLLPTATHDPWWLSGEDESCPRLLWPCPHIHGEDASFPPKATHASSVEEASRPSMLCFSSASRPPGASASHTRAPAASDTGDHAVTVPVSAAAGALTAVVPSESAVARHDDADDSDGLSSPGRARLSPALAALQPEVPFEFVTFDVIRGPIVYRLPHGQGAEEAILYALQHAPFPNPPGRTQGPMFLASPSFKSCS